MDFKIKILIYHLCLKFCKREWILMWTVWIVLDSLLSKCNPWKNSELWRILDFVSYWNCLIWKCQNWRFWQKILHKIIALNTKYTKFALDTTHTQLNYCKLLKRKIRTMSNTVRISLSITEKNFAITLLTKCEIS